VNIALYGASDTGLIIASRLCQEHNVTLVDELEAPPEKFSNLDISFISGSGADIAVLEEIAKEKADVFIACSVVDESNIIACHTAKKIIDIETICFVKKGDLYNSLITLAKSRFRTQYEIDTVIWPERLLTQEIFRIVSVPAAIDVKYFAGGEAKMFEYKIREDSVICNSRIKDCSFPQNVLIVGITRDHKLFIPDGSTRIQQDDKVVFIGTSSGLDALAARFFQNINKIKTAAIIGGGSVGFMLAQKLEEAGIRVKIIDHNQKRCEYLANNLKRSMVFNGDGTDLELLESESIGECDVAVCVTDNDEKNLLCSLLIKQLSSKRIITRVSNNHNIRLFEHVGIDVIVSPQESALKDLHNRLYSEEIDTLALLHEGQGELLKMKIGKTHEKTRVMDLKLPADIIIALIKRGRSIVIPHGESVIRPNDDLIFFTTIKDVDPIKKLFLP